MHVVIPQQADCSRVKTSLFTPDYFAPSILSLLSCISVVEVIKLAFSLWELSSFATLFLLWVNDTIHFIWLTKFHTHPTQPYFVTWGGGESRVIRENTTRYFFLACQWDSMKTELMTDTVIISCFQVKSMGNQVYLKVKWSRPFAADPTVFPWTFQIRKQSGILHTMQFLKQR